MALTLWYHPFSSYCQKALIALYETGTPFERRLVDLGDPEDRAAFAAVWPLAKFPVLVDEERALTLPEATVIVEYLAQQNPGTLIPADPEQALQVRLLDRIFDNYVHTPLQKIVVDEFRGEAGRDPEGVRQARAQLALSYDLIEARLGSSWAVGDEFSLADCAAAPALFYAGMIEPFGERRRLAAYYQRLRARPSFARAVDEARSYRHYFPLPWPEGYA